MRILILGGTSFVGHALTIAASSRGHEVTTFTRSSTPPGAAEGIVETIFGDRTKEGAYDFAADRQWDVVIDTWFGAPKVVHESATQLKAHAPYYAYVSTCSVYDGDPLPYGVNENSPTVVANPLAESTNYPADKRGAELAILESYGADASLIARPGLILGPREWPARLSWWLKHITDGGEILAPGPQELAIQYIDARDLANWIIESVEKHLTGTFNTLSPIAHCTMSQLLEECKAVTNSEANFTWIPADFLQEQGVEPWNEIPIWMTPDRYYFYQFDTSKAQAAGLKSRPYTETIADTWNSLLTEPQAELPGGRVPPGIDRDKEIKVLAAWAEGFY